MELYQLRYFQAVAEVGTLRDAAERLAVSQSAVSRAISMLEAEIGVELFTRRGRANRLNRFGQAFLGASVVAQRSLEAAVAGVRQLADADAGTVAVGFLAELGVTAVPRLIRCHRDRYPWSRFELRQATGTALVNDLINGVIDVCLSDPVSDAESLGVKWHNLHTQQLCAVVDLGHRLAHREVIGFDELADESFVAFDRGHTLRGIFDDACARHDVTPMVAFEDSDVNTLRGLIGARLGVGLLPRTAIPRPDIVEIAIDDKQLVRNIAAGWMTDSYLPPSAVAFRDTAIGVSMLPESESGEPPADFHATGQAVAG